MKRIHVNLTVTDLEASVRFYSDLFAAHPNVQRDDYAKWLIDDPRVNFAISTHGEPGLSHLGIQAETPGELIDLQSRMQHHMPDLAETTCCYAKGQKGWAHDPQGIAWEGFLTEKDGLETFGEGRMPQAPVTAEQPLVQACGANSSCC